VIDVNTQMLAKNSRVTIKVVVFHLAYKIISCVYVNRDLEIMIVPYVSLESFRKRRIYFVYIDLGLTCSSTVCSNGGTCSYNNTNIRCICPAGFTGARCEWSK
jgi:hypothetical protein